MAARGSGELARELRLPAAGVADERDHRACHQLALLDDETERVAKIGFDGGRHASQPDPSRSESSRQPPHLTNRRGGCRVSGDNRPSVLRTAVVRRVDNRMKRLRHGNDIARHGGGQPFKIRVTDPGPLAAKHVCDLVEARDLRRQRLRRLGTRKRDPDRILDAGRHVQSGDPPLPDGSDRPGLRLGQLFSGEDELGEICSPQHRSVTSETCLDLLVGPTMESNAHVEAVVPVEIVLAGQLPQAEDEICEARDVVLRLHDRVDDPVAAILTERVILRQVVPTTLPAKPLIGVSEVAVLLELEVELDAWLIPSRTEPAEAAIVALHERAAEQLEVSLRRSIELPESVPRQRHLGSSAVGSSGAASGSSALGIPSLVHSCAE